MPLDAGQLQGRNFAPVLPLRDAKLIGRNTYLNPSSSNAFFREKWQGLFDEHDADFREVIEQGRIISNLAGGKLIMKKDTSAGGYLFLKPLQSSRDRSNSPVFPQNVEILKSKWAKARPVVNSRFSGDGYKSELQAKLVDVATAADFRRIFTPEYELNEAISAIEFGTYITEFDYDEQLDQIQKTIPIIQNESKVLVEGYGACYDCQFEGRPDDFQQTGAPVPQCPECGGFRTSEMVPEAVADIANIVGAESIKQGNLTGRLLAFPACRFDPRFLAHDSSYFLYSERVPIRLLRRMFGDDLDISTDEADDYGLQVMQALSSRGGSTENLGESDLYGTHTKFSEEGTLRRMDLKPSEYAGFKLSKAEKTLSGTIPANVDWADLFPDGLRVTGFNNMELIVGYHAKKPSIVASVFLCQSFTGIGKGVADAVDSAKDLNELHSMAMAGLKRYGAGGIAYDSDAGLTKEDVRNLFRPRKAVPVDLKNTATGNINQAIMQIQAPAVNPVLPQYAIQLNNMISLAFMTGDFAQGMTNDVDIDTLGGQQLAHAKAEEQKGAILTMKVFHRCKSAEVLACLRREHMKLPRYYDGDRQGKTKGRWISGDQMPERVFFDAVPDSEIPQNTFEKKTAAREMIQEAGGLLALIQATQLAPEWGSWFAKNFSIEIPGGNEDEMHMVCLARLANIRELADIYASPDEVLAAMDKPVDPDEAMLLQKAAFLSEIMDDDEITEWPPLAKASLKALIKAHKISFAETQVTDSMIAQEAQAILAQQQAQQAQAIAAPMMEEEAAKQQEMQEGEQENQMMQEVAGRFLDDEQKQVEHERQQDADRLKFAQSEASAERQHERSLELEKAKAKLAPKPAPAKSKGK